MISYVQNLKITLLFLLFSLSLTAQTSSDNLVQILENIKTSLQEVQTSKETYIQDLKFDPNSPFNIQFLLRKIDKKGKESAEEYHFNLGLLNKNLVRWSSNKNQMRVSLKSGNQPAIKLLDGGELKGYEKEVELYSADIDNARLLEQQFIEAIPIAQELWKGSIKLPSDIDGLLDWLSSKITNISIEEKTYAQGLEREGSSLHNLIFSLEESGGKNSGLQKKYFFSLGDVLKSSIDTKIKGKEVIIEMGIAQRKSFIREEENGVLSNYLNQLSIYTNTPDDAHEIMLALKEAIPLSKSHAEEEFNLSYSNLQEGLEAVKKSIITFNDGETVFEQSISDNCRTEYKLKKSENNKDETHEYAFNFSDINSQSVDIEVKRKEISVALKTEKRLNFIRHLEDKELQNYANNLKIPVDGVASAKYLQSQIRYVAKTCTDEPPQVFDFDWLAKTLGESVIPEFTQELKKQEDDACKLSYTSLENGKNEKSELYEFNLYDLDSEDVALAVKGKQVFVNLETKAREKIINNYSNGDKLSYVSNFNMQFVDIPTAKNVVYTLKEMIKSCKK